MKAVKYLCDRCGIEIPAESHFSIEINKVDPSDRESLLYKENGETVKCEDMPDEGSDFCEDCIREIIDFIKRKPQMSFAEMLEEHTKQVGIEEAIEQMTPEKEEIAPVHTKKAKKQGNSSVDTKKILELLADGVQGKKIAEICDCQQSTVSMVKRIYMLDEAGKVRRKSE
ncbi:MAG: hypothetical protein Q4G60_14605 [bacterium]|nr:hypothetical protein [bacterium]